MQQQVRVGPIIKVALNGSGREEKRKDKSGGQDESEEGSHVLHDFHQYSEEDASALKGREDEEGLHALAQTE